MKTQKLIITVLIIIGFSVSMISYTFFVKNITHTTTLETQDFDLDLDIKLGSIDLDPASIYYLEDKEVYAINLFEISEANYIDNLSLSIIVDVSIASRLRFKLYESYELTRYYHNQEETVLKEIIYIDQQDESSYPFSLMKKGMFTNYFKDEQDYMYIDLVINPDQTYVFNIIDGGYAFPIRENSLFHETCYLYLGFEFEVVQANRYQEIWGLDTDPFNP
jgi:hypothetical protein